VSGSLTVTGRWISGSGNQVYFKICDSLSGTEIYSYILSTADPENTYTLPLAPGGMYEITIRSGGLTFPPCALA
jgi:hypothetical protein